MDPHTTLRKKLELCADLPSPAGIALRVIELCQDPEATLSEVAGVVSHDPAIAAKLMRMANSPLYARQRKTENIRQAIALFGLNGTLVLALGFSVVDASPDETGFIDHNHFWRRALACAISAQLLGTRLEPARKEELFLAALLQDIGMLALEKVEPELYKPIHEKPSHHEEIISLEEKRLQCDHAAVGAWMLENWNLPDHIIKAVGSSHHPEAGDRFSAIVALSSTLGDVWWHDDPHARLRQAVADGARILNLDSDTLMAIIEAAGPQIQESASAFEVDVAEQLPAELLLEKARELSGLMTVNTLQETTSLREKTEALTQHNQKLKEQSQRDNLTGLYNRAYLDQILAAEYRLAQENNFPLTVVFIDLDRFKQINDKYGHEAGDQALVHCARIILENTRHSDIVARYGGEEFVAVLPGTDASGAEVVCNRMLESLRQTPLCLKDHEQITVTASIGIASLDQIADVHGAYDLLRKADRALYSAKHGGRDQLKIYSA
ncbi:MAG TPA: GGDEF domain-containing protein [Gammaproteobacteria bacterium]|nr:GGDEF domain-containing protein [Gammaproteobacteria bacterium]